MNMINIAQAGVITDAPSLSSIGMNFLNFLLSVFGIIAILMLVVSGMMYFFSGGNEEKAKNAKKSFSYAVLGVILVMGIMVFVRLLGYFLG
ncbi:MAG: hypothetical protein HGA61_01415 [Candidatus Moranbacteria bacterium]|nr:hypothetical protein [Candidatus Moranbacteria bacterium]